MNLPIKNRILVELAGAIPVLWKKDVRFFNNLQVVYCRLQLWDECGDLHYPISVSLGRVAVLAWYESS